MYHKLYLLQLDQSLLLKNNNNNVVEISIRIKNTGSIRWMSQVFVAGFVRDDLRVGS